MSELTGQDLDDRAAELEIEGRSSMTADEKRAAIAEIEAEQAEEAADRDVPDSVDERVVDPGLLSGEASKSHGPFGFIGP